MIINAFGFNNYDPWIGLNDLHQEGRWVWTDGHTATRANVVWRHGEPNNDKGNENCAMLIGSDYQVNDKTCGYSSIGLCEKRLN